MAADLPAEPFNREEQYLADIAGQGVEVPPCPWSRKEAYLAEISGRISGMDGDIDELRNLIAALATDFSYKGSVNTYEDLPASPATGDVYTVADTGIMYVWDGNKWVALNMSGQEVEQSDWSENDPDDPAYIKNRTHYEETVENTVAQYGSTSAGSTPDSNYVWFIEKVEDYALSDILNVENGDTVYVDITYSVNGLSRTDGAKFTASVENNTVSLDSDAEAGNRWRGAYASELDGDTTFRWPVSSSDSSATVYITSIKYEKIKKLDAKYIPVDGDTITVNEDGELESAGGGGPTVVQTTGTSTTDVMSQQATSQLIYPSAHEVDKDRIAIGKVAAAQPSAIAIGGFYSSFPTQAFGSSSIAIGSNARTDLNSNSSIVLGDANAQASDRGIAIGQQTNVTARGAIALGTCANASTVGEMNIGSSQTSYGYNNSNYRLLTGLYDPQSAHDAATKGYVDTHLGGLTFVALTQAEYDALATKDANTLYVIKAA